MHDATKEMRAKKRMWGNSLNVPFMQQRLAVTLRDLPHIVYHSYELVAKRVLINMVIAGISPI